MYLRTTLLAAVLSATACSIAVPAQFSCPEPGKSTGCGANQICGPDKLCTTLVTCLATERRCNGVCTDVTNNRENCGDCTTATANHVCKPSEQCLPNATGNPTCTPFCAAGQTACAQPAGGFICENLSNDRANCGTCGNTCPQGQVCTPPSGGGAGHCAIECVPGLTNCSGNCLDLNTDDASCGACGNACAAGTHCNGGHCKVICTPGQTECPSGSGNCVDTTKDRANCGGCGVTCAAGQICTGSSCQVSCQASLTFCTSTSTCVNTVADSKNCGGCGLTCGLGQVCTNHGPGGAGLCELQCPAGETACTAPAWNPSTGYFGGNLVVNGPNLYQGITDGTSAASGGPVGTGTSITDGTAVWKVVLPTTASATQCVNTQIDRNNCGACDDVTNSKACASGQVCLGGHPVVSCAAGLTPCNGTCVDSNNDPTNCGACGNACAAPDAGGPVCGSGVCGVSCPAGETVCGGKCVDTSSDPNHCSTNPALCGVGCLTGQACVGGGCQTRCPSGSVDCGGKCIDPLHDNNNCGTDTIGTTACGHGCTNGQVCSNGVCSATCTTPPFTTCNQGTASAYCANTSYDTNNCGGCGNFPAAGDHICAVHANASVYCAGGNCAATCTGTFAHCTTVSTDVCETDLANNNPTHCGTCTNSCPAADNANPACVSGSCSTTCQAGFADCDIDPGTGCEADKAHDAANCGACGTLCPNTAPYCTGGCVAFATASGVQENLSISAIEAITEWGAPCFSESYSHVGTTLAAIQAACPALTGQVLVACAAPGAPTLLVAAAGLRSAVFNGAAGTAPTPTFYVPGASTPAFGFAPGAPTPITFSISSTNFGYDVGGTTTDGFATGVASQRLSWPVSGGSGGLITAGGRCGDRVGPSATSNYQRLVFTK